MKIYSTCLAKQGYTQIKAKNKTNALKYFRTLDDSIWIIDVHELKNVVNSHQMPVEEAHPEVFNEN